MRDLIIAWYAYSESGQAGPGGLPAPHRLANLCVDPPPEKLGEPAHVAGLFADVRQLDLQVSACGWKHLFSRYGLTGLIDFARQRGDWPADTTEATVAEAIMNESLEAGYDPVSGLIGELKKGTRQFEPTLLPVPSGKGSRPCLEMKPTARQKSSI